MITVTTALEKGSIYGNFKVLDIVNLEAFNGKGIWLLHQKTGMEIFHLYNDDEENLFSFAFATPPKDSTGVAHIIEHSVLCGSKHYPLKDPFLQLTNQSVKTFLNAMTFPDKTVYPASSLVEADYFNLMSVYGDAVFFPTLDERIFSQEAHRLEIDEQGEIQIQGVVFNEMKGNYSSTENIVFNSSLKSILPKTPYEHDSGGNPANIPDLTYDEFKAFHAEHYHPSKCKLFLYGNIPTEKQLDFIQEKFLSDESFASFIPSEQDLASDKNCGIEYPLQQTFDKPQYFSFPAPPSQMARKKGSDASVILSWLVGDSSDVVSLMEGVLLSEILLGHDGASLSKALLEANLGEDISPVSGLESEIRYLIFSVGLRGIETKKAKKLEKCVFSVLENLVKEGIPQEDVDSAIFSIDFSNREIKRAHGGPYSLVLMRRILQGWLHGKHPASCLDTAAAFQIVKEKIAKEGQNYLKRLIQERFLKNNHRTLVTVYADEKYEQQMNQTIFKNVEKLLKNKTEAEKESFKAEIQQKQKLLHEFQQTPDSEESKNSIPHLNPQDLSEKLDSIKNEERMLNNTKVFIHKQPVNGIVYLTVGFPIDVLSVEDYKYLSFFSYVITSLGFGKYDWIQATSKVACTTGGLDSFCFVFSSTSLLLEKAGVTSSDSLQEAQKKLFDYDSVAGRHWLFFKVKTLEEKLPEALELFFQCIHAPCFTDEKRIQDLFTEYKNDFMASLIPMGNFYAASRSYCKLSRIKAIDEIFNGLTQLKAIETISALSNKELLEKFVLLHKTIISSGAVANVICEDKTVDSCLSFLEPYFSSLPKILPPQFFTNEELMQEISFDFDNETEDIFQTEVYPLQGQIGFAALSFPAFSFGSKESVYAELIAHYITKSVLWEKIRTKGGAYGAFASSDENEGIFSFATYRDPHPDVSLTVFLESLEIIKNTHFDKTTLERMITGCYSKKIQPRAPANKGFTGFLRSLYGISEEERQKRMAWLLSATEKDLIETIKILTASVDNRQSVIVGENFKDNSRKIARLPL